MMFFGVGALAAAAIWASWTFGGVRGVSVVVGLLALAWVAERIDASWRAEAELAQTKTALTRAEAAFRDFRQTADQAAAAAAAKIAAIEQARIEAEAALAEHRQRSAAEFANLKDRIAANVPSRPQCDYPQPVLDGLRDAHARASR